LTTPTNPTEHPAEGTPPSVPADNPAQTAALPAAGVPPPPTEGYPPQYQAQPAAEPFAAVPRGPRVPWVNPARRGHLVAAAVVGALAFGGGGLLVGHALTDRGDHRGGVSRFEDGPGAGGHGFGREHHPREGDRPPHIGPHGPGGAGPALTPSGSPTR